MQRHLRIIEIAAGVALTAFIAAIMYHRYMIAYAIAVSSLIVGGAYLIAIARFPNRMDPNDRDKPVKRT